MLYMHVDCFGVGGEINHDLVTQDNSQTLLWAVSCWNFLFYQTTPANCIIVQKEACIYCMYKYK